MSTNASSPAHEPKPLYLKLAKRMLIAIIVVVLGVVPAVILLAITKEPAVTWATGAFIAGAVAVKFGGVDVGIKTSWACSLRWRLWRAVPLSRVPLSLLWSA